MAAFKLRTYNPRKPGYGPRLSNEEWERFRPILTELDKQGIPRQEIVRVAAEQHGFQGTYASLNTRLKEWGLTKGAQPIERTQRADDAHGKEPGHKRLSVDGERPERADNNADISSPESEEFLITGETSLHDNFHTLTSGDGLPTTKSQIVNVTPHSLDDSFSVASPYLQTGESGTAVANEEQFAAVSEPSTYGVFELLQGYGISKRAALTLLLTGILPTTAVHTTVALAPDLPVLEGGDFLTDLNTSEVVDPDVVNLHGTLSSRYDTEASQTVPKRPRSITSSLRSSKFSFDSDTKDFIRLAKRLRQKSPTGSFLSLVSRISAGSSRKSQSFGAVTGFGSELQVVLKYEAANEDPLLRYPKGGFTSKAADEDPLLQEMQAELGFKVLAEELPEWRRLTTDDMATVHGKLQARLPPIGLSYKLTMPRFVRLFNSLDRQYLSAIDRRGVPHFYINLGLRKDRSWIVMDPMVLEVEDISKTDLQDHLQSPNRPVCLAWPQSLCQECADITMTEIES